MKGVQCYELFGGIALKNHTFHFQLANDKKTWKKKTDEVLRGRRALDSEYRIIIIINL